MSLLTPLLQLSFTTLNAGTISAGTEISSVVVWSFKITYILLAIMLIIFSFVVVRQVKVMNETVTTVLGPIFRIVSIVLFIISVCIALATIASL